MTSAPWVPKNRTVKSGQQPLSRRLFITGGTVDLAGEEQTLNKFALKRWLQIARVEEIVLNSVAWTDDPRILHPLHRADDLHLHIKR